MIRAAQPALLGLQQAVSVPLLPVTYQTSRTFLLRFPIPFRGLNRPAIRVANSNRFWRLLPNSKLCAFPWCWKAIGTAQQMLSLQQVWVKRHLCEQLTWRFLKWESEADGTILHYSSFLSLSSTSGASQPRWMHTTPHRIPTPGAGSTPSSVTTAWPSRPAPGPYRPGCLQDR